MGTKLPKREPDLKLNALTYGSLFALLGSPFPVVAQVAPSTGAGQQGQSAAEAGPAVPAERPTEPSERSATLNVPLSLDGVRLGNVRSEITASRVLKVSATGLAEVLDGSLSDDARRQLSDLGSELVPVAALRQIGLSIEFDPRTLSLAVDIPFGLRGSTVLGGQSQPDYRGLPVAEPADLAAGVTLTSFTTGDATRGEDINSQLNVRGFANLFGTEGVTVLYGGDINLTGQGQFFRRDRILAFKDDPSKVLRYFAGDILPVQTRFSSDFDLLGIGIQRVYQDIQPDRNIRPLGQRSFLLERPALVEVYINGALARSYTAGPGPIDIRDIPATDLSNQVTIVVEDALGRREIDSFTLGNDINLLSKGVNEFSFSVGVLRNIQDVGLSYTSDPVASLFYTQGLSEMLTVGGSAVIAEAYQNAAVTAAFAALGGVTQIDVSASSSRMGEGAAVSIAYRGTPIDFGFGPAQTNLRAEYRTRRFQTLSSFDFLEDVKFDLAVDARANVSPSLQAVVGATYFARHSVDDDRYSLFGGFQKQLGRLNVGVIARYSRQTAGNEVGLLATAALILGRRSNIFATIDTAAQTGRVEFRQLRPLTLPEIDFGARAEVTPQTYEVGGRFGYATSRFDALIDVQQEYDRDTSSFRNQSSVRLQTGIGFANGTFGVGRDPALGFVMVKRHPSLDEAQVRVSTGSVGRDLGFANSLGPAVVPIFIPYRPQEIRVATENAPLGYNIGAGEYVAVPGARTGIPITVGSDDYRIAIANLLGFDGERVGLVTGRLLDLETGKARSFFTNRTGRAVFTELGPGRYRAEIDGTDLQFEFEVREDDPANISLGTIQLRSEE